MSSIQTVLAARSLRTVAVLMVAFFFIIASVRRSLNSRFDTSLHLGTASPNFSVASSTPITPKCSPLISENDFSPNAIRCRIQSAQIQVHSALHSQSSSPEQAVTEYKRRYGRNPPRGFEKWVQFALEHGSKVIDDFDLIDRDLKPYRTAEARRVFQLLNQRPFDWPRTRRITIRNGSMDASAGYMYNNEWRRLVEPFVQELPDSMFYMSLIDEPRILLKSGLQPSQVEFEERPHESIEDLVKDSCSQIPRELTSRLGYEKDVCLFSDPSKLHGLISSPRTFSYTHSLAPILSFGRMSAFQDILIPCPCYATHPLLDDDQIPFLDKSPRVYWRGSSTGAQASRFTWKYGHRERFVSFVQSLQNAASVLDAGQYFGAKLDAPNQKQISLFKDVFDINMGAYIQCDQDVCEDMERFLGPSDIEPEQTSMNYRFLYDIDGNSMSTRFYRLLSQRAVVLKQTWFQEWHDDRLIPWAHYIPVTMEMKELPALLDFLINDPVGEKLSAEIAESSYTWSHQALRKIDMSIYIYRLLLEMADLRTVQ